MNDWDSTQDWEQFKIEIDQAGADQIFNLLSGILPGSLVLERNYGDLFPDQLDDYQGPALIIGYYPAAKSPQIRSQIERALLEAGYPSSPEFSDLIQVDWTTAWRDRYQPIPVGQRLIVVPSWLENPYPDRLLISMDPGMAFGSGTHPTTQISLELIEGIVTTAHPDRMIDLGCGSGILSITAAKLGVARVLGLDVDREAVHVSRKNAAANMVADSTIFQQGSVEELLTDQAVFQQAPLVVANIIAPILEELFEAGMGKLVPRNGWLVLSGILEDQAAALEASIENAGFSLNQTHRKGEWIGLVGEKTG